ncbi:unnamed protein product [Heligmosomoides polygyrus]|uniref:Uncharacterized protein n=1 Tax=Heligmosomoides polygyrus TaxID=6339 RepID=A0A183FX43_HELPZ|nr:unnamed protein product [Heligmosomoides polygyrus]
MSLLADIQAPFDKLQVHNCEAIAAQVFEAVTILRETVPRIAMTEHTLNTLLDRSSRSRYVFSAQWTKTTTTTSRKGFSRFTDTVARTGHVSKLRLCLCCLMTEHIDDCRVKGGNCGLDHNVLLCTRKKPSHPMKRPHH